MGERAKVYDDDDDYDDKWLPINKQDSEKKEGMKSNLGSLGTDKKLSWKKMERKKKKKQFFGCYKFELGLVHMICNDIFALKTQNLGFHGTPSYTVQSRAKVLSSIEFLYE